MVDRPDPLHRKPAVRYVDGRDGECIGKSAPPKSCWWKTTRPDVVLLDLNLPGMGGLEFLGWIKSTPVLRRFPVIVQPAASHPDDVRNAYDNGASGYLVKPIDMDRFIKAIRAFEDF